VANPARESLLLAWDSELICTDWSPDGRLIVFESHSEKTQSDLWILPVANSGKPEPLVQTPFAEYGARFSPDGRWIAYVSNESGQDEIYVQGFPSSSRRIQVSAGGGEDPTWRADGKEIFYVSSKGTLMAAGIAADASGLEGAPPKELFRITGGSYTAAPDGQRFLAASGVVDPSTAPVTVVLNWTRGLKDR
jgi:dipeptidyl aminopeptidase/acylaminoacyl peptidase